VLEGSVRRTGNKVRVNAQLIDAESGTHLRAEQFDGDIGDFFALQNEIPSRIAVALNVECPVVKLLGRPRIRMRSNTFCEAAPQLGSNSRWATATGST